MKYFDEQQTQLGKLWLENPQLLVEDLQQMIAWLGDKILVRDSVQGMRPKNEDAQRLASATLSKFRDLIDVYNAERSDSKILRFDTVGILGLDTAITLHGPREVFRNFRALQDAVALLANRSLLREPEKSKHPICEEPSEAAIATPQMTPDSDSTPDFHGTRYWKFFQHMWDEGARLEVTKPEVQKLIESFKKGPGRKVGSNGKLEHKIPTNAHSVRFCFITQLKKFNGQQN